jgi:hypothetical protein
MLPSLATNRDPGVTTQEVPDMLSSASNGTPISTIIPYSSMLSLGLYPKEQVELPLGMVLAGYRGWELLGLGFIWVWGGLLLGYGLCLEYPRGPWESLELSVILYQYTKVIT